MSLINHTPKRILIRSTNWIGDAVMTTPAVHSIRENFPDAEITMLSVPWVADIFRMNPDVDKHFIYDKKLLYQGKMKGPLKLAKDLKPFAFDMAFLLQNSFEAALITKMAGIPVRAGYKRDGRGILLTHGVKISQETKKKHHVHYYQDMLAALGLTTGDNTLRLPLIQSLKDKTIGFVDCLKHQNPISHADLKMMDVIQGLPQIQSLNDNRVDIPIIGFNPGAAFGPAKQWPIDKFAKLAELICDNFGDSGCIIMVFGTDADSEAAANIRNASDRCQYHVLDMTGKTSLKQAMSLIKCCDAFVTNDSGLMHVAAGLDTPSIAIFGSTDHIATGPFSDNSIILRREIECSPCMQTHCPKGHLKCLESISAEDVYEDLAKILSKNLIAE